ncbi:MAG: FKBP-type peptidyl-prolyl cis-trans isomerase [Cyclobacteriaceae bacterium]
MKGKIMSLVLATTIVTACSQKNKKTVTESGLEINFIEQTEGRVKNQGDFLFFNMKYTTDTDSVLFDTSERGGAVPISYDSAQWKSSGSIYEAFTLCKEGDSISFSVVASDLFEKTFRAPIPEGINKDSQIKFFVGLEKIRNKEELDAEIIAAAEGQIKKDGELIDKYLDENDIDAITTESGLRYVITEEGSGANAVAGQNVQVHYHGTLLDGTKFDSSIDRGEPFSFVLGQGRVIRGWDEGFALLNKGTKATLYIPSSLAYGNQARSAVIKENSILKFDVELLDIN